MNEIGFYRLVILTLIVVMSLQEGYVEWVERPHNFYAVSVSTHGTTTAQCFRDNQLIAEKVYTK